MAELSMSEYYKKVVKKYLDSTVLREEENMKENIYEKTKND